MLPVKRDNLLDDDECAILFKVLCTKSLLLIPLLYDEVDLKASVLPMLIDNRATTNVVAITEFIIASEEVLAFSCI